MEQLKLASVKFKSAGKVYYFSTDIDLEKGVIDVNHSCKVNVI